MTMRPDSSRFYLASASPRRAELLRTHGYTFEVRIPRFDEPRADDLRLPPPQLAEALSYFKARSVAEQLSQGVVLAADTVVALGDRIFGKPVDRDDARRILEALVGTTHQVITGVTLLDAASGRRSLAHDATLVTMRPMSAPELDDYLATGAWQGKAGAYGIQDHGDAFVTAVTGSFSNVVGLPMELVCPMLAEWGITPQPRPAGPAPRPEE